MSWGSFSNFLSMGGYGLYVWGSYAVVFTVIAAEIAMLALRRRNILNQLRLLARQRRQGNRETS